MNTAKSWLYKVVVLSLIVSISLPVGAMAGDYIIGIGDRLSISRIIITPGKNGEPREAKDREVVTVRPDGKIAYPLIGEVKAGGLTPLQLRKILTDKLGEYIKDPQLTVNLEASDHLTVYIFGNLRGAGPKKVKGNTTILQLFSGIGTLPDTIDLKNSFLVRDNKKMKVDLYALINEGDLSQNIYLKNGDTVFFKTKVKPVAKIEKPTDKFKSIIRIIGEVRKEQALKYEKGMTILDAILRAGGFTPYARPSGTKVVRRRDDKVEEITIDMDAVRGGEVDKNILLEPGDVISVPASLF